MSSTQGAQTRGFVAAGEAGRRSGAARLKARGRRFVVDNFGYAGLAQVQTLRALGRPLRLKDPRTFSDLVQRRMLFERTPELAWTCDKQAMKDHVAAMPGVSARIPETLWFGDDLTQLQGFPLHGPWVAKPNNSSGQVFFGTGTPDAATVAKMRAEFGRQSNPFAVNGEWAYSQARPGFLVEPLLNEPPLPDYKVFVFHGFAAFVRVSTGRGIDLHLTSFDRDGAPLAQLFGEPTSSTLELPELISKVISDAEAIASGFDFMRVDFYVVGDHHYFGETTPYPGSGKHAINRDFDRWLGELWLSGSRAAVVDKYPEIAQFRAPAYATN